MSGASLIFNSKQLEELESLHDSTGAFEEESDESGVDDVGEGAMEWRRSLIEEASENVKRAKTRPVDPSITYEVGSLLLDRESQRFGRVNRSVPGYLRVLYLTGGDREYGLLDVHRYLQEAAATRKLSELALQLGMAEVDVERELDHLGLAALDEDADGVDEAYDLDDDSEDGEDEARAAAGASPTDAATEAPDAEHGENEDADGAAVAAAGAQGAATKKSRAAKAPSSRAAPSKSASSKSASAKSASAKVAAKAKDHTKSKSTARSKQPATGQDQKAEEDATSPARKARKVTSKPARSAAARAAKATAAPLDGRKANPIDDPNEFIRQNYTEMSNRELARHTGLSEHTIRRKLGEWGLKRRK